MTTKAELQRQLNKLNDMMCSTQDNGVYPSWVEEEYNLVLKELEKLEEKDAAIVSQYPELEMLSNGA